MFLGEPIHNTPATLAIPFGETLFTQSKNPKVRLIKFALNTIRELATRSMSSIQGSAVRGIVQELEKDIEAAIREHLRADNRGGQESRDKNLDQSIVDALSKAIGKLKEGGTELSDALDILLKSYDGVVAQGIIAVIKASPTRIEAIMGDYQLYDVRMTAFERSTDERVALLRENLETIFTAINTWTLHRVDALKNPSTAVQSVAKTEVQQLIHDLRFEIGKVILSEPNSEVLSSEVVRLISELIEKIKAIDIQGNPTAKSTLIELLKNCSLGVVHHQGDLSQVAMDDYWIGISTGSHSGNQYKLRPTNKGSTPPETELDILL